MFELDPSSDSRHIGVYDASKVVEIKGGRVKLLIGFNWEPIAVPNGGGMSGSRSKNVDTEMKIPVKFEELFYNKAAEPFRVICIEHPTTGPSGRAGDLAKLLALKTSEECQRYLYADTVNRFVLNKMETSALLDFVAEFARGVRSESEIAKSTAKLVDHIVQQLVCANVEVRQLGTRQSVMKQFEVVVETWTLQRVGPTVMSALVQSFDLLDREVHRVLRANQGITLQNLHLRPELICDFSSAIEKTSYHFDRVSTPMEKLYLMQDIIENIQNTIELSLSSGGRLSDNVLASDDLIPIVVFVLLQAKPQNLVSTLYYAKHFTRLNLTTSQLGFHLTTFTAAAEFIKTDHLPQSGFSSNPSSNGSDYIAHPLDPVSSPHFDPFAAGIEKVPSHAYRTENRRSMSYITPPVLPPTQTTSIATGRSFGTKSTPSAAFSTADHSSDYGYGYAPSRQLSRSISSYDHLPPPSQPHQRSASSSQSYYAPSAAVKRQNYGATSNSAQPLYSGWTEVPRDFGSSKPRTIDTRREHTTANATTSHASTQATYATKGPESITISPQEAQTFFSNLKSYGNSRK